MPLTIRENGNTSANLVTAQWWNDFFNLLTGTMNDQPVTISYLPSGSTNSTLTLVGNGNANILVVQTNTGTNFLTLNGTGTLYISGVSNFNSNVNLASTAILDAAGGIIGNGKFGFATPGDLIDGSGYDTYIKARGASNIVHLQQNGADIATFALNGMSLPSTLASISVGSVLGIKTTGGVKLAEFKSNGTMVIGGTTYYTTQSTANFGTSAAFDGFDLAECYLVDQEDALGTGVCPNGVGIMSKCTHDGCRVASVITRVPGFCIGVPEPAENILPIALIGKVIATAPQPIGAGVLVCSDGQGNVRALASGEETFALGFSLQDACDGQVGMFIRPVYVKAP